MKKLFTALGFLICVLLMTSLASCGLIDGKINEATAPLNEQISALEGEIADLNSEIADLSGQIEALENENGALESDKAKLEAEKAALESDKVKLEAEKAALESELAEKKIELACTKGEHTWDGESEVEYEWSLAYQICEATFDCAFCDAQVVLDPLEIIVDENDAIVAKFSEVPSDTVSGIPYITDVSFNTDSEAYDAESNTFTISKDNSFVLTFSGVNLDTAEEASKQFGVMIYNNEIWYIFDYVYGTSKDASTVEKNKITYTLDIDMFNSISSMQICGFGLVSYTDGSIIMKAKIDVNLVKEQENDTPADEWTVVTTADELLAAGEKGGKIRFGTDIESEKGVLLYKDTVIDLAGYDLRVIGKGENAFWSSGNVELFDSVGGSLIYPTNYISGGIFKLIGDISFESSDYPVFNGWGALDLSEYTGDELFIYAENLESIVIPEGYVFYDFYGNKLSDFAAAREEGYVYIRPKAEEPDTSTDEWTVVTTSEELEMALEKGGHIKFGADIESENGFLLVKDTVIDLAGYDLKVTGENQSTFWNCANIELLDSVGGSTLYEQILINGGTLKFSGSIKFDMFATNIYVKPIMIAGIGVLDLSGYTGEELYISYPENVILPEGYACYDFDETKLEALSNGDLIFIRKDDTAAPTN